MHRLHTHDRVGANQVIEADIELMWIDRGESSTDCRCIIKNIREGGFRLRLEGLKIEIVGFTGYPT